MATPQKQAARGAPAKTPNRPAQPAARPAAPAKTANRPAAPAPAAKPPGNAVVPRQANAVVQTPSGAVEVPDYIKRGAERGSEHVSTQDLVIPRIELAQALSPCVDEQKAEYIEGCRPGMLYNSVTRALYGNQLTVIPVFFKKQFLCWRDRKAGGGFGGAFDTMQEALDRIQQEEKPDEWEAIETAQQLVLTYDPETGDTSEAVVSMARTKQKVSRQWNSLIRLNGFDRFSRMYNLFGIDEQNTLNQDYKNFGVQYVDWTPVEPYKRAEQLYNSIASGERKFKVDENYEEGALDPEPAAPTDGQPSEY